MKVHILILLVIPLVFGCEDNKIEILSERFELVNGTLEFINSTTSKYNDELYLKLNIDDQFRSKPIKEHSEGINRYLNKLKEVLVEKTGGRSPETAMLVGVNDFKTPYEFISKSVYRRNFKDTLNSISNLITEMNLFNAPSLALDGSEDPYWSQIPVQKHKTIIQLLFEGVNISVALATISQLQLKVLEYERKAYETVLLQELDSLRALSQ